MSTSTDPGRAASAARRHLLRHLRTALGTAPAGAPELAPLTDQGEDALVQGVMRHRLAALLHPSVEEGRIPEPLPVDFPGLCRQAYFTVLRRNIVTLELGEALLHRSVEAGIRATPRGPWAWMRGHEPLHPDPGQRPIDGLVLSVPNQDQSHARDLARSLGFRESSPANAEPAGVLWREQGRLRFPLQIEASAPPPKAVAAFVDAVRGLAAVRFTRWLGLVDIHRLAQRASFDGERACAEAERRGLMRPALSSLRLARELLGTPVDWELLRHASVRPVRPRPVGSSSPLWMRGNP